MARNRQKKARGHNDAAQDRAMREMMAGKGMRHGGKVVGKMSGGACKMRMDKRARGGRVGSG